MQRAANWLAENNPYLCPFAALIPRGDPNGSFSRAEHLQTDYNPPPINSYEIIVPNYNFPKEVHNEDFHYT
ncbi:12588_t:CDS:1, partial [Gigaspora rosea]